MNSKLLIGLIVVIIIVILVILLNGSNAKEGTSALQDEITQNTKTDVEESENVQEVDYSLKLKNYSFTPDTIEVKAGETIRVKLTNTGGTHDFVIDELNVQSSLLGSGEEEIIEITASADAKGSTYEFYCSVGNHRELGMVGEIKIV